MARWPMSAHVDWSVLDKNSSQGCSSVVERLPPMHRVLGLILCCLRFRFINYGCKCFAHIYVYACFVPGVQKRGSESFGTADQNDEGLMSYTKAANALNL